MIESIKEAFVLNFIVEDRWRYLTNGLLVTLKVTFFAALMGIALGLIVALIRNAHEHTGRLRILNALCSLYLTVIRGTPVLVQLMLIYFAVFSSVRVDKAFTAILAFGINSGAYQAEIFRAGIQSLPKGQFEAGRSLGFSYTQTMLTVILPQAVRNIIPTLCNEFITLLKETSVASYIALEDLTKGGDIIRSRTYDPFLPLLAVALIYLVIVMLLTYAVKRLEGYLSRASR